MSALLPSLARRLDRAQETGSDLDLSTDDVRLLFQTGAIDDLRAAIKANTAGPLPELPRFCSRCCQTYIYFIRQGEHGPINVGY